MTLSQEQFNNPSAGTFEDWLRDARTSESTQRRSSSALTPSYVAEGGRKRRSSPRDSRSGYFTSDSSTRRQGSAETAYAPRYLQDAQIDRKFDEGLHRPAHLRPLPTGEELKEIRRPLLVKRFFYLTALTVVALSVLAGVVAQAEIGKMSLAVDSYNSTIASLKNSNQQLGLTEATLASPARIARYAQAKLHMTFATTSGVATNNHLAFYSATSQPYSEYYTPAGAVPTTVVSPSSGGQSQSQSASSSAAVANKVPSNSAAAVASTSSTTAQQSSTSTPSTVPATTSPPTTTASSTPATVASSTQG